MRVRQFAQFNATCNARSDLPQHAVQARQAVAKLNDSVPNLTPISQPNDQTLEGSFYSVSRPIFATKYSMTFSFKTFFEIYKIYTPLHRSK